MTVMRDTMNAADAGFGEILGKVEYRVVEYGEGGVHCGWSSQSRFRVGNSTNLLHHSGSAPKNTTVMRDTMNAADAEVGEKLGKFEWSSIEWSSLVKVPCTVEQSKSVSSG